MEWMPKAGERVRIKGLGKADGMVGTMKRAKAFQSADSLAVARFLYRVELENGADIDATIEHLEPAENEADA